jgi:uncharacterized protein (UPF0335 family)
MSDARLANLIARSLRLREERREISADIRDVAAEAKALGYDSKIFGMVVKRAEMEADARLEMDALVEAYEAAVAGVALGDAPVTGDPKLQKIVGGRRSLVSKLAWHDAGDI